MADPTRIEQVFLDALNKADADRPAFVAEACGADSDLRREVERLLAAQPHVTGGYPALTGRLRTPAPAPARSIRPRTIRAKTENALVQAFSLQSVSRRERHRFGSQPPGRLLGESGP